MEFRQWSVHACTSVNAWKSTLWYLNRPSARHWQTKVGTHCSSFWFFINHKWAASLWMCANNTFSHVCLLLSLHSSIHPSRHFRSFEFICIKCVASAIIAKGNACILRACARLLSLSPIVYCRESHLPHIFPKYNWNHKNCILVTVALYVYSKFAGKYMRMKKECRRQMLMTMMMRRKERPKCIHE